MSFAVLDVSLHPVSLMLCLCVGQVTLFAADLGEGEYIVLPATTGAILRARDRQPTLKVSVGFGKML